MRCGLALTLVVSFLDGWCSQERQYAEKMLKGAIKSGKNNDLTVARQMMTDVQRKTALSTLQNMGYQCQRSNADFKNSTASNSTKKASVPKPTATVKNGDHRLSRSRHILMLMMQVHKLRHLWKRL